MTAPRLNLTNWGSRSLRGVGHLYGIMAKPRRWEIAAMTGTVRLLCPSLGDLEAVRAGDIDLLTYRARFLARLDSHPLSALAPGQLFAQSSRASTYLEDDDTLCCSCARDVAAVGGCHRCWAAARLSEAGWSIWLDGQLYDPSSTPLGWTGGAIGARRTRR